MIYPVIIMKQTFIAGLFWLFCATAYAMPDSLAQDMPRNPRGDSACLSKNTAATAGNCPHQIFSPEKNQAIEGYSPIFHKH